ncbi:hypothetical protein Leryth_013794 [Lithospermum erythrorhizon]|nr:hypothetical protein Leryth_013794 [Lithospermum erythrorhizon]
MVSQTVIVYVQVKRRWSIGLAIPTFLMFFSCLLFFAGSKHYIKKIPDHSPIKTMTRVLVATIKKRRSKLLDRPQHSTRKRRGQLKIAIKIPRRTIFVFPVLARIIWIRIYDRIIFSKARKITKTEKIKRRGIAISQPTLDLTCPREDFKNVSLSLVPQYVNCWYIEHEKLLEGFLVSGAEYLAYKYSCDQSSIRSLAEFKVENWLPQDLNKGRLITSII